MKRPYWLGACLVSSFVLCTACGDGGGGTGGSGNAGGGGQGGAGGSGGSGGGSDCPAVVLDIVGKPDPTLGFSTPPGGPGTASLSKVSATELEMTLGAGGQPFTFTFQGPDLTQQFTVGEIVNIGVDGDWSFVTNTKATVATARGFGFVEGPLSVLKMAGPAVDFSAQCSIPSVGFCSKMPQTVSPLRVDATLGADMVSVDIGASVLLGAWTVTNVVSIQYPGDSGEGGCIREAAFRGLVTLMGPALP